MPGRQGRDARGRAVLGSRQRIDDRDPTARRRLRPPRLMGRWLHSDHSLRSATQARDSSPSYRWQQDAAAPAVHEQQSLTRHTLQAHAGTRRMRRAGCSRAAMGREGACASQSKLMRTVARAWVSTVSLGPVRCSSALHQRLRYSLPRDRHHFGEGPSAVRPDA